MRTDEKTDEKPKPDVKKAEADRKKAEQGQKTFTRPGTEKRG